MTKLPNDAFDYFFSLGPGRTLAAVAAHFGVSAKTVQRHARADKWDGRAADRERQVRAISDKKAIETLADANERHLKIARIIQRNALEALARKAVDGGMDAVRALDIAVKQERLILGEPTERTGSDVESIIKREYERWLIVENPSESAKS